MTPAVPGIATHRVALFIWASMVLMLLLFLGVVIALGAPVRTTVSPDVVLAVVVAVSVFGVLLSLVLPQRMSTRPSEGRGDIAALTRLVIAWALCDAVALFPLIAFLLTRDLRLLLVFTADLGVLVAWWPTRARWDAMSRFPPPDATGGRMVR